MPALTDIKVIYKELEENKSFLVKNLLLALVDQNHWFLKSFSSKSIYFGYWIKTKEKKIYKLISDIELFEEIQAMEILSEKSVDLITKDNKINISLDKQGLLINSSKLIFIRLYLDIRKLYCNKKTTDFYKILLTKEGYFINFFDPWENYNLDFQIIFEGNLKFINEKITLFLDYDQKRQSSINTLEIIKGFEGTISRIYIFPHNKEESKQISGELPNLPPLKNFILKRILSLYNHPDGFLAGLPWFPQRWLRDELWSLLFLNRFSKYLNIDKEILNFYLENLENIWNKNKENGEEASDTLLLLINAIEKKKIEEQKNLFTHFLNLWEEKYLKKLPPQSTWMDTLDRPRAIEIDLLYYSALKKLNFIEKSKKFKTFLKMQIFTKSYPQEELFSPNIFLGYFITPDFFEDFEWLDIFDKLIENYYLKWGGFSSKNINSSNFKEIHTGENPESYHSGDSWMWINNIACWCLKKVNYLKYEQYIRKIEESMIKNLLALGVPGYISELSSAESLKYEGSLIQLWSLSSLFLNL